MNLILLLENPHLGNLNDEDADVMFGGSRSERKICHAGWKREWKASRRTGAFGCLRMSCRNKEAASVAFDTEGFSKRTCLPALRDLSAHS
jgi:hypothetical protein